MALLYQASLVPSKLELIGGWAPHQPWFVGAPGAPLATVASFRFDDPEGAVGIETLLIRAGDGPVLQVPLTYRNAQRPGSQEGFIATMEHSVLGTRWVYDATLDPVYRAELARVILTGDTEVEQWIEIDGELTLREPTARVVGSGGTSALDLAGVALDEVVLDVVRTPGQSAAAGSAEFTLTGTWADQQEPIILATASTR